MRKNFEPVQESTVVASIKNDNTFQALDEVFRVTKFHETLETYFAESGKNRGDFRIVIKPNFMFAYSKYDRTTFTDPELVEYLVEGIDIRGYSDSAVAGAQSTYGNHYDAATQEYSVPEVIVLYVLCG
jgi:hypothetical protein